MCACVHCGGRVWWDGPMAVVVDAMVVVVGERVLGGVCMCACVPVCAPVRACVRTHARTGAHTGTHAHMHTPPSTRSPTTTTIASTTTAIGPSHHTRPPQCTHAH